VAIVFTLAVILAEKNKKSRKWNTHLPWLQMLQ